MDLNSFEEAITKSKGVPTTSLFAGISRGLAQGTLKLPSFSQLLETLNRRPPDTFPAVENEDYTYSPLPTPTSLRLLKFCGIDEDGLLRCSLTVVDLEEQPLFNCLSYTWV